MILKQMLLNERLLRNKDIAGFVSREQITTDSLPGILLKLWRMVMEILKKYFSESSWGEIRLFYSHFKSIPFYLMRVFRVKNNKIIITNYKGNGYGDNGKYIAEYLLTTRFNLDIVWVLESLTNHNIPSSIRCIQLNSLKYIYELSTAKIWIDNSHKDLSVRKRKSQFYIQTWHGGIALKKIESDAEDSLSSRYKQMAQHDAAQIDLLISNSDFCTRMYKRAFWYHGRIAECGDPRCDIIINGDNVKSKVAKYYSIPDDTNILLYAPTFRADQTAEVYNIDYEVLNTAITNAFGGSWSILVRMHPNNVGASRNIEYNSRLINATFYDDMYELLATADILITDYSSSMFEFSYGNKPVFIYASDISNYIRDRNFYFDIFSLPYPVAENTAELANNILNHDKITYESKLGNFLQSLGLKVGGSASRKVGEIILSVLGLREGL